MPTEKTTNEIFEPPIIPPVPPAIKEAGLRGKLIIFVGAGLSRLVGSPSWDEFANAALYQLCMRKYLNHAEIDQLRNSKLDAKTRISIAKDVAKSAGISIDFSKIIEPNVPTISQLNIFLNLVSIGATFVTTNYDLWIEKAGDFPQPETKITEGTEQDKTESQSNIKKLKSVYKSSELRTDLLYKPGNVIHLHGCLKDNNSMVISTREYLEHYEKPLVKEFLQVLFNEFTVLFLGYGIAESEILEHVFRKKPISGLGMQSGRHYWLFPVFSYQAQFFNRLKTYYRNHCNVELVAFSRDEKDYSQQIEIIDLWSKEINYRSPGFSEKAKLIDRAFK